MIEPSENRAFWLSSFSSPGKVISLAIPTATTGSAIVRVEATFILPYTNAAHSGKLPALGLKPLLVPDPCAIGRIYATGSDSVKLKPGDMVLIESMVVARDDAKVSIM